METDIYKTEYHRDISGGSITGEDVERTTEGMYNEAKQKMSEAYDKTSQALSGTYDQAITYVKENPAKTTLIALGIGVGLGLLLASGSRRSRMRRFGEPIVNALSDIALEVIRGL